MPSKVKEFLLHEVCKCYTLCVSAFCCLSTRLVCFVCIFIHLMRMHNLCLKTRLQTKRYDVHQIHQLHLYLFFSSAVASVFSGKTSCSSTDCWHYLCSNIRRDYTRDYLCHHHRVFYLFMWFFYSSLVVLVQVLLMRWMHMQQCG